MIKKVILNLIRILRINKKLGNIQTKIKLFFLGETYLRNSFPEKISIIYRS